MCCNLIHDYMKFNSDPIIKREKLKTEMYVKLYRLELKKRNIFDEKKNK